MLCAGFVFRRGQLSSPARIECGMKPPLAVAAAVLLAAGLFSASALAGANWPQLRGPDADGTAKNAGIPLTWSTTENIAWKTEMPGPGSSSPIIWDGKVFVTCWSGYGDKEGADDMTKLQRHLVCLSLEDGKVLWDSAVPAAQPEDPFQGFITEHGYASNTPVTDGERVYVFFGKSGALAFDFDGKQLWQVDLGRNSSNRRWGSAASPVLHQDTVIVNASDESRAIYALDKKTGSQLWKAEGDTLELAYSSPVAVEREGGITDLVIAVPQELWALNPETGKLRWYALHELPGNVSPALVVTADSLIMTGGYPRTATAAFSRRGGKGDVTAANKLWETSDSSYVPSPVLHEGRLYVINDQGFAICMDAKTGQTVFRERAMQQQGGGFGRRGGGKPFYASPILADGRLICVSRRNGALVMAAEPQFKILATNVIEGDSSQFNGTPAVSGGRMLLRSERAVYCIQGAKP